MDDLPHRIEALLASLPGPAFYGQSAEEVNNQMAAYEAEALLYVRTHTDWDSDAFVNAAITVMKSLLVEAVHQLREGHY